MVGFYRCFLFLILLLFFPVVLNAQTQLYEKQNVIRVKLEQAYGELKTSSFSRTSSGYVQTGVPSVDILNNQFGALQFKRVFSDGGKFRKRREKFGLHLWYEITFDPSKAKSVEQLLRNYSVNIAIQEAEPLYAKHQGVIPGLPHGAIMAEMPLQNERLSYVPNDPRLGEQWHYNNTGQTGGTAGADIKLFFAWDIQKGSPDVIVSIHDGGIDAAHSDLSDNMWVNTAEFNGTTGIDDDNNGYIDDIYGYNLADGTGNILPGDHGTHVAGTVAAATNNGVGVAGVAGGSGAQDGVRLMSCQVFGNNVGGFAESYAYAADNGSIISQNSWGYTSPGNYEQSVLDAIDYFIANAGYDENGLPSGPMQGGIVIFAAGNSNSQQAYYPGYYEPVLSVASTNHNDSKSWYSNYGTWVDISAPGGETSVLNQGVLSTLPNNSYGFFQGTSMACPHVSGVAALIVSQYGGTGFTPEQLRYRLVETTDEIDAQNPSYVGLLGTGRMNALGSLLEDDGIAPDAITDLAALEVRQDQVVISWTAPSDTDNVSAASYEIRYSESPITEANYTSAQLAGNIEAQSAGNSESFAVTGLSALTSYYFAIKSFDFFSNSSAISNPLNAVTTDLPVIEVTPLAISSDLYVGESEVRQISISNNGEGILEYYLSLSNSSYTPARLVLQQSEVFRGSAQPIKKNNEIPAGKIYKTSSYTRTSGTIQPSSSPSDLQTVLDSLNAGHASISSLIPNSYSFIGGESGYNISDGGNDMYDGGNALGTNLGSPIYYSNNVITASANLNNQSYFTIKHPGLMVFAANLDGQSYFEITGNVGADGSGSVDGVVLNISKNGKSYLGFVKRIYGTSDPSVNHLIIVEDNGSANHEFSTNTDSDYHQVNSLVGVERIYYLLFAGTSGGYIDNTDMLNIMDRFISLANGFNGVHVPNDSGELRAGETALVDIDFDARGLDPGQYLNTITIENNTASGSVAVETELNVVGAANIIAEESLDFGQVYIGLSEQLHVYLKNTGNEDLLISSISSDDPVYVTGTSSGTILPGDSLLVEIDFSPVAAGVVNSTVTVLNNDPNGSPFYISLVGEGMEPPVIDVDPLLLTESLLSGETSVQELTISNTGNAELTVNASVNYTGVTPSSVTILREITGEAKEAETGKTKSVTAASLNVTLHDLAGTEVGVFGVSSHSILNNDLASRGATITGLSGWPIANINAYDLLIIDDAISGALTSDMDILIAYIQSGGNVILQADNPGSATNINYVISQTTSSFISLNSFNDGYFTDISTHPTTENVTELYSNAYGGYYSGSSQEIVRDNSGRGHVVLETLGFGSLVLMANEMMNDYDLAYPDNRLFVNQVVDWITGNTNSSWLIVDPLSGAVAAQGAEPFSVTFDASGLYGGTYTAELSIDSNDPVNSRVTIPVTLEVTGIPAIDPSADEIAFADTYLGQERIDSIYITNSGTDRLHVTNITSSNTAFEVSVTGFDLQPEAGKWLVVSFAPLAEGAIAGTITIESDDPINPSYEISLTGNALEPPLIGVDPTSFTEALFSGETSVQTLTISNSGNGELAVSASVNYTGVTLSSVITLEELKREVTDPETGETKLLDAGSLDVALNDLSGVEVGVFAIGYHSILNSDLSSRGANITGFSGWPIAGINNYDIVIIDDEIAYAGTSDLDMLIAYVQGGGHVILQADNPGSATNINYFISQTSSSFTALSSFNNGYFTDITNHPSTVNVTELYSNSYGGYYTGSSQEIVRDNSGLGHVVLENIGMGQLVLMANEMMQDFDLAYSDNRLFVNQMVDWIIGNNNSAWLNVDPLSGVVAVQGAEPFSVTFDASGLYGGTYTAEIYIDSNDPVTARVTIPVTLDVTGVPLIELSADELPFAETYLGQERLDSVYLSNTGVAVLHVSNITSSNTAYTTSQTSFDVEIGDGQWVVVAFTPSVVGATAGILTIESNDPVNPSYEVTLTGNGVEPPVIEVNPISLTEVLHTDGAAVQTLTISNTGNSELVISMSLTGSSGWLDITSLSGTIPAQGSESFSVNFDALGLAIGTYQAEIHIDSNDPVRSEVVVPVNLEVTGSSLIELSSNELNFPDTYLHQEQVDSVLISNTGTKVLHISDIISSAVAFTVSPTAFDIEPGSDRWLHVLFSPSTAGVITGSLLIENDGSNHPSYEITLTGNAIEPPVIEVNTTSLNEALNTGGTSEQTLVITNGGNTDLVVSANPNGSGSFGWFSINSLSGTVAAQTSQSFTVNFDATGLPGGTYSAEIHFNSNDPVTPQLIVSVMLEVTGIPMIHLSAQELNFVDTYLGEETVDSVLISNNGTKTLNINAISSSNEKFAITADALSLNPGETYSLLVSYKPSVEEESIGDITIVSNDLSTPSMVIIVKGKGLEPPKVTVSPGEMDESLVSGENSTRSISIFNTGKGVLNYDISVAYSDGAIETSWLTIAAEAGQVPANANGTNSVFIDAAELQSGEYFATIIFNSNDPENTEIEIPVFLTVCDQNSSDLPKISGAIGDHVIDPDDGKILIDLESVFSSSNQLQYGFYVDNPTLADVTLNGPILSVKPLLLGSMNITLYAFDDNCGKIEHSFLLTIDQITATDGDLNVSEVKIYPNPMDKRVGGVIEVHSEVAGVATILLTDINGREIQQLFSGSLTHGMNKIEVANMNAQTGVYLIRIEMDKKVKVLRLMVK